MMEKSEVLQILEKIEWQLFELEMEVEHQIDKERMRATKHILQRQSILEKNIDSLEKKMNKTVASRMYSHLNKNSFRFEVQKLV